MKSLIAKRSIVIDGHKTSVSIEDAFWSGLKEIAQTRHMTLSNMVGDIDTHRGNGNLSSTIRLFVLDCSRNGFLRPLANMAAAPKLNGASPQGAE